MILFEVQNEEIHFDEEVLVILLKVFEVSKICFEAFEGGNLHLQVE
jgi:hypothetical protein